MFTLFVQTLCITSLISKWSLGMTKVIAVTNQKGGCGKSMVIRNLALMRAAAGYSVILLDLDDGQYSLDKWYTRREDLGYAKDIDYNGNLTFIVENSDLMSGVISKAKENNIDSLFIDLPGRSDTPLASALLSADFSLCPLSGSPDDYDVLPYMGELMDRATKYKPEKKLYVIHNKGNSTSARRRESEYEDLKYQCTKNDSLSLTPFQFRDLVAMKDSVKYGLSLFEYAELTESGIKDDNPNLKAFNELYTFLFNTNWSKAVNHA